MSSARTVSDVMPTTFEVCCNSHRGHSTMALEPTTSGAMWRNEVGYIVIGYPRLSESFITQELLVLESLGAKLRVYAIKPGDDDRTHDSVRKIRAPLTYLPRMTSLSGTSLWRWLRANLPTYAHSHRQLLKRRPLPYLRTLASAIAMSWRYRPHWFAFPKKVYIKEFLQAGYVAHAVLLTPTIRHLHGHFCHGATTITWFASRLTGLSFSFTAHAKDIYQQDQNPGNLLERKVRAASFVTTCTKANSDHLAHRFPKCEAVQTIYHGLDTQYFAPDNRIDKDSVPLILSVGRLVEKKGLTYLVSACDALRQRNIAFKCLIVGEPGDHSNAIRTQIAALHLQELITVIAPVTHDALRELYARASVFVLPCLIAADGDRDGIPNVLAEAMAMALPVITTAVSGIPELVRSRVDGISVPQRDSNALADALTMVLDDAHVRKQLGLAARERVCAVFDTRTTTVALKSLFERTMNEASSSQ